MTTPDLDGPTCGQGEATPWLLLAAAWGIGAALTAGWVVRTAWAVMRDPDALRWLVR